MKLTTTLSVTALTIGAVTLGYAVYFDYKRRNNPEFRKQLRKQSKSLDKAAKREQKMQAQEQEAVMDQAVEDVTKPGVLPAGVQERESFFMEQVAVGEALFAQGPSYHVPAAMAFFKALKVYPAPVELVMIYQKAVPKEVFDVIMQLVAKDAAKNGTASAASMTGSTIDDVDDDVPSKSSEPAKEQSPKKSANGSTEETPAQIQ
ncbi:mitochondrial import receptor subunit tom20 [Malassezia vespertilionis]|uniref:Tom20p n=1 Tax=Malassezia vespertilionis TaxID=2020962 RepID=A0A2N1J838_9BASI|nr:mitochondrial import receptor subunit tom20 [Malassezia vespertilionis]PKI82720.1 hypothetical protein MVES_003554 [Malassezia vespertilionis]WFD08629.1 mitochondrial import receptor subunit tom20 [Malassezia vespertilionis]